MSLLCQLWGADRSVAVDRDDASGAGGSVGGDGGRGVGLEEVPDASGEVALEAADGFAAGFAFGLAAGEGGGGLGVDAAFGDGQAVQGAGDLGGAPRGGGGGVGGGGGGGGGGAGRGGGGGVGCGRRRRGSGPCRRCGRAWRRWRSGSRRRSRRVAWRR